MKQKMVTCKNCGKGNLVWAVSKAGKYYLTDSDSTQITGEGGRVIKALQLGHKCLTVEEQEVAAGFDDASNEARALRIRYDALREVIFTLLNDVNSDNDEIHRLDAEAKELFAQIKAIQDKYNDGHEMGIYK